MTGAVVRACGLGKSFGSHPVLRDVTASAEPGDVIGLLGKNGAGKTTLLEVLLGFSPPSAGTSDVFGEESLHLSPRAKARIGFVPQEDEVIPLLTGAQQLRVASAFYPHWDPALAQRLAADWEIPLDVRIRKLSPGVRQKLSLVLALAHHPELLVLDEPVASLDPIARRAFLRELLDIGESEGRTVLFSSHIVTDLERAANKVWILKEGRLVWQSELDTLKESVVRLHLRGQRPLSPDLGLPNTLSQRIDGTHATVAVSRWDPAQRTAIAARLGTDVEVEPLGLEEIFVELHR